MNTNSTVTFAQVRSTGDIIAFYSDDRLKKIFDNIANPLDKVLKLNGFNFVQNEIADELLPIYKGVKQVGLSAQQVYEVLPEVVKEAPIGEGYMTVQYERIVPLLIEAIKELNDKVEELKNGNSSIS